MIPWLVNYPLLTLGFTLVLMWVAMRIGQYLGPTEASHRRGQQRSGPGHQCQPHSVSTDHRLQFLDGNRTL
jgi:hypothetical protein